MKIWLIIASLFVTMSVIPVLADDAVVLQSRLDQIHSFYAKFSQRITSAKGDVIQEGKGELWVKNPNLFYWHMTFPEESKLISDGKTLWFYNPLLEQVTASWLKDATCDVPFILTNCGSAFDWHKYHVKQRGDSFFLVAKDHNHDLKQIKIQVNNYGTIKSFIGVDQYGQSIEYQLQHHNPSSLDTTRFNFTLPHGVMLDDQRQ